MAPQRIGRAVLARHQARCSISSRVSTVPGCRRSGCSSRCRCPAADGQLLVERQASLDDHQGGHQPGDGRDGQHGLRVLGEQDFVGLLVHHKRHTGLERERGTSAACRPSELAKGGHGRQSRRLAHDQNARIWRVPGGGLGRLGPKPAGAWRRWFQPPAQRGSGQGGTQGNEAGSAENGSHGHPPGRAPSLREAWPPMHGNQ